MNQSLQNLNQNLTKKANPSKWTEDWINIQSITNGMIILPDQNKVSGVKITPRNIFILDEEAQASALIALTNFYNTIDYEFWLVVADRPVDISMYLSQLQLQYQKESNPQSPEPITPAHAPGRSSQPARGRAPPPCCWLST